MNNKVVLIWRSLGPYHLERARALAHDLGKKNTELVLVALCGQEKSRDWIPCDTEKNYRIEILAPNISIERQTPSLWKDLKKILERESPIAVAVAGYDRPEMRSAMKWCRHTNAISILMSATKRDDSPRPWWKVLILKRLCALADTALVSGSAAKEHLANLGIPPDRIFQPYGVVDNAFFKKAAIEAASTKQSYADLPEKYFFACGRLIESRKNYFGMIDAYKKYRAMCNVDNHWGLVICGDGVDRRMIEDYAKNTEGVVFAGSKQKDELAQYYAFASGFIHTALKEAWGLVVNEAMAAGLPVIVSERCGCCRDLVEDKENGFIIDPLNHEQIASRMRELSEMPTANLIAMGEKGQERIKNWSPEKFAEGIIAAIGKASQHNEK